MAKRGSVRTLSRLRYWVKWKKLMTLFILGFGVWIVYCILLLRSAPCLWSVRYSLTMGAWPTDLRHNHRALVLGFALFGLLQSKVFA